MTTPSLTKARDFVNVAEFPPPPPIDSDIPKAPQPALDAAKEQAAVVGGEVIAFVKGVTAAQRADIVNASLLAQLIAKKKVPSATTLAGVAGWYDSYFDALANIGFAIQDKGFAEYHEQSDTFQAHKADPRRSGAAAGRRADGARTREDGALSNWIGRRELLLSLMAFGLEARLNVTQVLFFKFRKNDVRLQHHAGNQRANARGPAPRDWRKVGGLRTGLHQAISGFVLIERLGRPCELNN
jgi:hypothetical protein